MTTRDITVDASNTDKATIVDADRFPMTDSETTPDSLKEVLFSLIKSTLKTYFDTLYGASVTQTLTNKRIQRRAVTVTQSATPTINTDNGDIFNITGLAQAITSLTTNLSGTPVAEEMIMMNITDDGTGRAITPGASFVGTNNNSLTGLTTVAGKKLCLLWKWSATLSKWELFGKDWSL